MDANDQKTREGDDAGLRAQEELKRGYLHVSFGQYDEGIKACRSAAELAPDHHLPPTLEGSFEMAAGRLREALGTLRKATRRHPDQPLPWLYFAEACFLSGRRRQGERALGKAQALDEPGEHGDLIADLRQTWQAVEPSEVPPPLVPKVDDEPAEEQR
jgi:predicted Zn-dependent protease